MPKLLEIATEYAHLKCVEPKPVMIAMAKLIQICGDKDIQDYDRKDARTFVDQYGKVKTTTIRRRLNSINAVFNWAAYELDLEPVSYTHLRAHETKANLVCRLLLEKKKNKKTHPTA